MIFTCAAYELAPSRGGTPWAIPVLALFKIIRNNVSFMWECQADSDAFHTCSMGNFCRSLHKLCIHLSDLEIYPDTVCALWSEMWEVKVCFIKLTSVSKICGHSCSEYDYFHVRWHSDVGFRDMLVY